MFLMGCESPPAICLCDVGPPFDANRDAPLPDAPLDTHRYITPPPRCGYTGTEGGHCRDGMCAATLSCEPDRALALTADLGIPRGEPDPDQPGELRVAAADPTMDVSLRIATGSLCTRTCDIGAAPGSPDACGDCGVCTRALGVGGLLDLSDLDEGVPSDTAGWCRTACTFDPLTSGGCPVAHTCDEALGLCIEACESDAACEVRLGTTPEGLRVWLRQAGARCNVTVGRCE